MVVIIINFHWGYFVLGNDNYSPEEAPLVSVKRLLVSPAWRDYRGLGVPSDSEQVDIFRSGVDLFLNSLGVPLWLISQLSVSLVFFLGSWSIASLSLSIFKKKLDDFQGQSLFLLTGVFYFTNILTLWLFFSPLKPFIFVWGFLPFFLWQSWNFFNEWNLKTFLFFLLSILLISSSAIVPTIFLVVLIIIVTFYFWFYLLGINLRRLILVFGIFIIFQLYWLVPFGFYVKSNASALTSSYINRIITPETIGSELKYNNLGNVLRFYTSWLDIKNDDGEYLFKYSPIYQNGSFFSYLAFLPILLTFLYLIKILKTGQWKRIWPLVLLLFFGIFLIKRDNSPLGFIYQFFENNIPLFRQVFRWGSSKFWPLLSIIIPILASLFLVELSKNYHKVWRRIILIGIIGCQLFFVWPIFKGDLINKSDLVKIPKPYFELKDYLYETDKNGRIYLAPEANNLYFRNHNWGFFGSVLWSYLIPNPIIEKSLTTGSQENEIAFDVLVNTYYSEDPNLFFRSLKNYKVKWVIADKSVTDKKNGYRYDWNTFNKVIESNPDLTKVWQKDFLSLYKVNDEEDFGNDLIYTNHDWNNLTRWKIFSKNNTEWWSIDGNYGKIFPLFLKPDKLGFKEGKIVLTHIYKGEDITYKPSLDNSEQFPVNLNYDNGKVEVRSAIPKILVNKKEIINNQIGGINFDLPKQTDLISLSKDIWDFKNILEINFLGNSDITENETLSFWKKTYKKISLSSNLVKVESDLIIKLKLSNGSKDLWKKVCIKSDRTRECLNQNISVYFVEDDSISSDYIFLRGPDTVKIFLPEGVEIQDSIVWEKISNLENDWQNNINFNFDPIEIKNGDLLEVEIPILKSRDNSFELRKDYGVIPEYMGLENNILIDKDGLKIENQRGVSGFYLSQSSPQLSNNMMLVAAEVENLEGIPVDLNFRDTKAENKLWTERMGYLQNNQILETFILPIDWKNYIFEAAVWAVGRDKSVNKISNLVTQPIPLAWGGISLVPEISRIPKVVGINKAKHSHWSVSDKREQLQPAMINGWEQAFVIKSDDEKLKADYWPNQIVWAGWLLNCLVIIVGVEYFRKNKVV